MHQLSAYLKNYKITLSIKKIIGNKYFEIQFFKVGKIEISYFQSFKARSAL